MSETIILGEDTRTASIIISQRAMVAGEVVTSWHDEPDGRHIVFAYHAPGTPEYEAIHAERRAKLEESLAVRP